MTFTLFRVKDLWQTHLCRLNIQEQMSDRQIEMENCTWGKVQGWRF